MASFYRGDLGDLFGCIVDVGDASPAWFAQAACRGNTTAFFLNKGQPATAAKAICAGCEVRPECLDYAIAKRETRGIWGGMTNVERRRHRLS